MRGEASVDAAWPVALIIFVSLSGETGRPDDKRLPGAMSKVATGQDLTRERKQVPVKETCKIEKWLLPLSEAYYGLLSKDSYKRQIAHHLAHVAPEAWLAMELAYLVNNAHDLSCLTGWTAWLEHKRVDVTLIPPLTQTENPRVHLELKLITPDYWNNWEQVYQDLANPRPNGSVKPIADAAVCFLINPSQDSSTKKWSQATKVDKKKMESVPNAPGYFRPLLNKPERPPLYLFATSPELTLEWPHTVHGRWPHGYAARFRVLWVTSS